jgi:uncharacterized protein
MKIPDVNVLVNSVNLRSPHQPHAVDWLQSAFSGSSGVGLAWSALVGFLRVSTQRVVMPEPLQVPEALELMDRWLSHPRAQLLHPTARHADILARLLLAAGTAGNLTNDAHLAALALEHDATVGTFDKDFKRFSGVKFDLLGARN